MLLAENRAFALAPESEVRASIRVALVGGARLYRSALRALIQSDADFHIAPESRSAAEVLARVAHPASDVVLLDVDEALTDPIGLLQQTASTFDGAAILLLVGSRESVDTDALILAGARGIVFKDVAANHLLTAIRRVHAGEVWVDRATASRLIGALAHRPQARADEAQRARIGSLSPREHEVVKFVADGLCNKAIAKKMGISDNTVRHHLTSIYAKLETRDRLELVIYAFRYGVVASAA